MDAGRFKEKDSENLVRLLNFIASNAKFNLEIKEVIELYGLMAWAQQELKAKIDGHILEVKAVYEAEPEPKKPARRSRAKKGS